MSKPLCISTLDLQYYRFGGAVTKALVFAQIAKDEGFSPFFLTPSLPLHRTVKRTLRLQIPPHARESVFAGYPCHEMGAILPEFEFNAHRFHIPSLKRLLDSSTACFAVSGNNSAARPFLDLKLPFSVWPGSTFWEDCCDRFKQQPWNLRKIVDSISRTECERLEFHIFSQARQIAADTHYTRKAILSRNPAWVPKLMVTPIPVDCRLFHPPPNASRQQLVFIGRLSDPRKNISLLLEAFSRCAGQRPQLALVMIGSGDESTRRLLQSHSHAGRIRWLQGISEEEKIRELQNAAALIIPSFQEGFGITGAEAMACGAPVITTPCGGPEDFVVTNQNGFLLNGFTPDEMTDAILRLTGDQTLQNNLARQAREHAEKHLSLEAVKPLLLEFLHGKKL
ncbi:MAG: glycosyltransferase family 4 protein [Verrucomicrobiae bacterium]|nr:glycosyltransferase family 4 protein [Verrucomicrobiae bacterium]